MAVAQDLLEILRCPYCVSGDTRKPGDDPGRLELVHNAWLVSGDTGYKYPIKDGIPIMLIEEGERWKDTPIEELPMPPESAEPLSAPPSQTDLYIGDSDSGGIHPLILIGGIFAGVLAVIGLWRWLTSDTE